MQIQIRALFFVLITSYLPVSSVAAGTAKDGPTDEQVYSALERLALLRRPQISRFDRIDDLLAPTVIPLLKGYEKRQFPFGPSYITTTDCHAEKIVLGGDLPEVQSIHVSYGCLNGRFDRNRDTIPHVSLRYVPPAGRQGCDPSLVRAILANILARPMVALLDSSEIVFAGERVDIYDGPDAFFCSPTGSCYADEQRYFFAVEAQPRSLLLTPRFVAGCQGQEAGYEINISADIRKAYEAVGWKRNALAVAALGNRAIRLPRTPKIETIAQASSSAADRACRSYSKYDGAQKRAAKAVKDTSPESALKLYAAIDEMNTALKQCTGNTSLLANASARLVALYTRIGALDKAHLAAIESVRALDALGESGTMSYLFDDDTLSTVTQYATHLLARERCPTFAAFTQAQQAHVAFRTQSSVKAPLGHVKIVGLAQSAATECGQIDSYIAVSSLWLIAYHSALAGKFDDAKAALDEITARFPVNAIPLDASSYVDAENAHRFAKVLADALSARDKLAAAGMAAADVLSTVRPSLAAFHLVIAITYYPPADKDALRAAQRKQEHERREYLVRVAKHRKWLRTPAGKAWAEPRCKRGCEDKWAGCLGGSPIACISEPYSVGCPHDCAKDRAGCIHECGRTGRSKWGYDYVSNPDN